MASGTLPCEAAGADELCDVLAGCYSVVVSGGCFPSERSWQLTQGGMVLAEGGAPETVDGVCTEGAPTSTPTPPERRR